MSFFAKSQNRWILGGLFVISIVFLGVQTWQKHQLKQSFIEGIKEKGSLKFLVLNSPTTYYQRRAGEFAGLEYDLATEFAGFLDVTPKFEVYNSVASLLEALAKSTEPAIAAAGLSSTNNRKERFDFGPGYQAVTQQIVCREAYDIETDKDLEKVQLVVTKDSSYIERLEQLTKRGINLKWRSDEQSTEELLRRAWLREIDCVMADSNIVDINRRYYPPLKIVYELPRHETLNWLLPKDSPGIKAVLDSWFADLDDSGRLESLQNRYYGFIAKFDPYDTKIFNQRRKNRLPKYLDYFKAAEKKYGSQIAEWPFLAAMAYQESQWNPRSQSPTGVRGMMMLTQATAKSVGVTDRLDPEQSIDGGARYFKRIKNRLPKQIKDPSRDWFALAAYNIGYGHLQDAWKLAKKLGKNPFDWAEMKTVLPLLSEKKYYSKLKYGYARGSEPVRYVSRIRHYMDLVENKHRRAISSEGE